MQKTAVSQNGYLVNLVADKHFDDVMFGGVSVEFVEPGLESVKCLLVADIVDQYDALCATVVAGGESPEPFLTSGVLNNKNDNNNNNNALSLSDAILHMYESLQDQNAGDFISKFYASHSLELQPPPSTEQRLSHVPQLYSSKLQITSFVPKYWSLMGKWKARHL